METRNRPYQPEQPPKQAAYVQASNPVTHTPQEQRASVRQYGDPPAPITRRGADSKPSDDAARARVDEQRNQNRENLQNASNVNLKYGVELQPAEGYIADSVERKGMGIERAQAGAHAGPVGSAAGPGHPGFGEQKDLTARMDQKRAEHERLLGDKVGHSPPEPNYDVAEREAVRQRKLEQNENVNVGEAVKQTTGDRVVGDQ